ncbi:MAG: ArsB/NhaD family transporter [Anaerolineae bacterium]|nr:ArsB/NhaD family transporter [Anaerolineae bacterium]
MTEIVATTVFVVALGLIFTEKWHRMVVSGLGAAAMVGVGLLLDFYDEEHAIQAIEFETLALLLGMMILVALLRTTGFFESVAILVAQRSNGSVVRLLLMLGLTTSLLSMVLDNVTTVVLMAPMSVLIAEFLSISPVPLLISQAIFSNIGGMATLVGDPPNILIGAAAQLSFNDFLTRLGPIVLVVWGVTFLTLRYLFRAQLRPADPDAPQQHALHRLNAREALTDPKGVRRVLMVLGGVIVLFMLERSLHVTPAFAALAGAGIALAWTNIQVHEILKEVEWDVILFFIGLFVMVGGLEAAGVLAQVAETLLKLQDTSPVLLGLIIMWSMVLLSALIDNVPVTIAVIPIVLSLGAQGVNVQPIWWAIALGAGLGGNATPIGSTANVIVISVSERTDRPITDREWLGVGVPVALVATLVASALYIVLFNFLSAR